MTTRVTATLRRARSGHEHHAPALEGLVAQGGLTPSIASNALAFFKNGQNADGGWAIEPAAADNQQTSDPDSTSLVIQAHPRHGPCARQRPFDVGGQTPDKPAVVLQVTSGTDAGAFSSAFGVPARGTSREL